MAEPVHIGVLRDVHAAARHDYGGNAMRLVVEQANAAGGVQGRPVELVEKIVSGPSFGTRAHVDATVHLWRDLADDERVLGIIGPSTTPCVVAVHGQVEAAGIPQIHWAGTDQACGDWHFQYQAGYLPDEGRALAFLLVRNGLRRVICFRGEGAYGDAYLRPFIAAAGPLGIEILREVELSHTATDVSEAVTAASTLEADAVVGMGLLGVGGTLAEAIRDADWKVPCFGNCGFVLIAAGDPRQRELFSGWTATDMLDPQNAIARSLFDSYQVRYGERPVSATATFGHDLALLAIEGLRCAPEFTRAGFRAGLETLRDVPAATGGAGSYMGFSARDRLALKGPRLFLFKKITPHGFELVAA